MHQEIDYLPMTRETAERVVFRMTFRVEQYKAVKRSDAAQFGFRMDKVRNVGPTQDTLYPWNVIDFLSQENRNR